MSRNRLVLFLGLWFATGSSLSAADPVDFAHDVLPILNAHCVKCHTNGTYKGSFTLDTRTSLLDTGAVDPEKPGESELIRRVTSTDAKVQMPPEGARLSEKEVAVLRNWIAANVPWEDGFTFRKATYQAPLQLKRIRIPRATAATGPHPIDRILYWYGEFNDVSLAPPADDATFLRRASLDLIGLTPTEAELEAFLSDTARTSGSA